MDVGFLEAELAFKAGADITTVCACADNQTIKSAVKATRKYKKKIIADLISVKNPLKRAKQCLNLGVNLIGIHTAIDIQKTGKSPLTTLKKISKSIPKNKISIAGGINQKNIKQIKKYQPEIIVIGGAITKSKNPKQTAKKLKQTNPN